MVQARGSGAKRRALWFACVLSSGCLERAAPESARDDRLPLGATSELLHNARGELDAYAGIGRLLGGASPCTAVVVAAAALASAPAYALTAARCVLPPSSGAANTVLYDVAPPSGLEVLLHDFVDTPARRFAVGVAAIPYATRKGRDLAVLRLDATVGDLAARGVRPLPLAGALPVAGSAAAMVGVPQVAVPPSLAFLRRERCSLVRRTNVVLAPFHEYDALATSCEAFAGGSEGSALVDARGAVLGIASTSTVGPGDGPCLDPRPCEVGAGASVAPRTTYAVDTTTLVGCFAPDGSFRRDEAPCGLEKRGPLRVTSYPVSPITPTRGAPPVPNTWNIRVAGVTTFRYELGEAAALDCRTVTPHGPRAPAESDLLAQAPVPELAGVYVMCLAPVDDAPPGTAPSVVVLTVETR